MTMLTMAKFPHGLKSILSSLHPMKIYRGRGVIIIIITIIIIIISHVVKPRGFDSPVSRVLSPSERCDHFDKSNLPGKVHDSDPSFSPGTSCKPSHTHTHTACQITQLSLSFHNITTFPSPHVSLSKLRTCPPRRPHGQKNVLNLAEERLNPLLVLHHSHMSTFINSK